MLLNNIASMNPYSEDISTLIYGNSTQISLNIPRETNDKKTPIKIAKLDHYNEDIPTLT